MAEATKNNATKAPILNSFVIPLDDCAACGTIHTAVTIKKPPAKLMVDGYADHG